MTPAEARIKADELNQTGRHRERWFYYPTYHAAKNGWFVMRRQKRSVIHVAVFIDGKISGLEE